MLFTSPRFFAFLVATLIAISIPKTVRTKKVVLALASALFYAAWDYRYLGLLLGVGTIDHLAAVRIDASDRPAVRRTWLALSIVSNLGILGYFKYANFFLENLSRLGLAQHNALSILLPAGISFYTFKSMSYTIDVYRREITPCRRFIDYLTFLTFFPELIAGPIVRASVFLPQMDQQIGFSRERMADGMSLFLLGLTKKVGIADLMGQVVDPIFLSPGRFDAPTLWLTIIGYTIQIYADFSGYSDMAIGCAKMIGYDLPENFRMPYLSQNPSEFWRRWHITLSSWLRDYLYIPLGGNRGGVARTYLNLFLTMLLGGLWHGASWNFVLWGALHGAALGVHRFADERGWTAFLPLTLSRGLMLLFAMLCWIPFRARNFDGTWNFVVGLGRFEVGLHHIATPIFWALGWVVLAHALGLVLERVAKEPSSGWAPLLKAFDVHAIADPVAGVRARLGVSTVGGVMLVLVWLGVLYLFATFSSDPFIYFQF